MNGQQWLAIPLCNPNNRAQLWRSCLIYVHIADIFLRRPRTVNAVKEKEKNSLYREKISDKSKWLPRRRPSGRSSIPLKDGEAVSEWPDKKAVCALARPITDELRLRARRNGRHYSPARRLLSLSVCVCVCVCFYACGLGGCEEVYLP